MEQKTEASQAVDELLPCPFCGDKMELPTHDDELARGAGLMYVSCDCGAMGASGKNRTEAITAWNRRAALKAQPAPTEPQDEKKPFAWAYRAIGSGDWRATMDYKWAHAIEGMETKPLYDFPAEATQPDRHALQAEGKHPAPCARHCEATAFGIEIRRLTAENAQLRSAQGEDSARLDAERDVLAERQRQVETERLTTAQDDEYKFGELAKAAICYVRGNRYVGAIDKPIDTWPFNHGWWKPTTDRRNLVKAGALIIAEIERIDRARASAETGGVKS